MDDKPLHFVRNMTTLKEILGNLAVEYHNYDTARNTVVGDAYETLTVYVDNRRWFSFVRRRIWKITRFCNKILTKSASQRSFAVDDLYNCIYVHKVTGEPALMASENIDYTEAKFRSMVRHVCSIMLLFGDRLPIAQGKPSADLTFTRDDVPDFFKDYKNYLYDKEYNGLDRRAAFDPPMFWEPKEQKECIAASRDEYWKDKVFCGSFWKGEIKRRWFDELKTVKTELGEFYRYGRRRKKNRPTYDELGDIVEFARNSLEDFFDLIHQDDEYVYEDEVVIEFFDEEYNFTWNLFRVNLQYSAFWYGLGYRAGLFLGRLGFKL